MGWPRSHAALWKGRAPPYTITALFKHSTTRRTTSKSKLVEKTTFLGCTQTRIPLVLRQVMCKDSSVSTVRH